MNSPGLRFRWRILKSHVMQGLLGLCLAIAVFVLLDILFYIVRKGWMGLDWSFFTELPTPVGSAGGGIANSILGSLSLVSLALLIAIPWGVGVGIFIAEYASSRLSKALKLCVDLLLSVPSIIAGLFIYTFIVVPFGGFSAYAGAAALSLLALPMIIRSTEEAFKLLPQALRDAGLALGIPRWRVIFQVILQAARGPIITGILLSLARIAGETAPLMFTAFDNKFWPTSLAEPTASIPLQIFTYASSPFPEWHQKAWTAALLLVFFVMSLNLGTRILFKRKSV